MSNVDRKLASIRTITEIRPIPEADAIECAYVGGWPVVVKKREFSVGELALYIEPDGWVPHELASFLSKGREPREYNGVKGERLKTQKIRKQLSQGLLLPITDALQKEFSHTYFSFEGARDLQEGDDLTEMLGIQKWEAPIPTHLAGQVRGNFPSFIPRTDQERCLPGDTSLETCKGRMTIEELCENRYKVSVKSLDIATGEVEMREVTGFSVIEETDQDWFCLTTKTGKKLIATGDHKVWCQDLNSFRRIRDIKPGQLVLSSFQENNV